MSTPTALWTLDKNWQTGWTVRRDGIIRGRSLFFGGSGTQFDDDSPEPNAGRLNQCSEIPNQHMMSPGRLKQKTVVKT